MSIRDTLLRLGIEPKKSLGQNFMIQKGALIKMADAAEIGSNDLVLEIGAGLGALTDILAQRARRVIAIEIDDRLVPYLRDRYAGADNVEIVQGDVLTLDLPALLGDAPAYKVVANLPYYITSAIIRLLLESQHPPQKLVITVQRELAERVVARGGKMSILAVSVLVYGQPKIVTHLKAGNFYPRPNIQSSILTIEPYRDGVPVDAADMDQFFRIVRAGFSQRRKQIKNCLKAGLRMDDGAVVEWLTAAGIAISARAESLTLDDWIGILQTAKELDIDV